MPQLRQEVASTLDVFATVADAAGVPLPTGKVIDSVSLLPLLTDKSTAPPRNASFFYAVNTAACKRPFSLGCVAHTDAPLCSRARRVPVRGVGGLRKGHGIGPGECVGAAQRGGQAAAA